MKQRRFFKSVRVLGIPLVLSLMLLLAACYPNQPETVEEYDVVYTNYTQDFNFANNYTYSLPDKVLLINDRDPDDPPEFVDDVFGEPILESIRRNLNAQGWTEVDESENPRIVMLPSAFETTFIYFYPPGYWCWYYPCWGWGYPGYVPAGSYSTGTVLIQMTDTQEVEDDEVPVVWVSAYNGLLQGSDDNKVARINRNLDQAFSHPPFN